MQQRPDRVVARVPVVVRFTDCHGKPVLLSGRGLNAGSTGVQNLLRWAYFDGRPDTGSETVTVAFLEESQGGLDVEYLVIEGDPSPRRWRRLRRQGGTEDAQGALEHAMRCVHGSLEVAALLLTAGCAQWAECDNPNFVDVVLDGTHRRRVPAAVRTVLHEDELVDLVRGGLAPFGDPGVARLILGHDPESPGRYQETVITGSPGLTRFLQGESLRSLIDEASQP